MNYFIFNPISGSYGQTKKRRLLDLIQKDPENIVLETMQKDDEITLTQKAISLGAKRVIAIGGDGTINKVASLLSGTDIPLGIIPMGSGNGLARHLNIPLNTEAAFRKSISGKPIKIDVCRIDEKTFVCTSGFGFDAFVADVFDKRKKRGLLNYIIAVIISLMRYKPIEISINDEPWEKLFLLTISNANQYGNNAYISPNADIQDGQFEIIKIKHVSKPKLAFITLRLFLKNIHQSSDVAITRMNIATIKIKANQFFHIDGESLTTKKEDVFISIQPGALQVIL
ncbi:MAG: Diacylglycerol kinase [Bacteroidota bacterium]